MFPKMEPSNGNPFAEFMWMEEQEEFDKKVIEELLEEDQIEEDYEDMIAEERYHLSNSLQLPPGTSEGGSSNQQNGHTGGTGGGDASTVIPQTQQDEPVPWSSQTGEKSSEVSSDSDSEGGGPQR